MLNREIAKVVTGTNETVVIFNNGSTIQAVNASQNTRGMSYAVFDRNIKDN